MTKNDDSITNEKVKGHLRETLIDIACDAILFDGNAEHDIDVAFRTLSSVFPEFGIGDTASRRVAKTTLLGAIASYKGDAEILTDIEKHLAEAIAFDDVFESMFFEEN